MAEHADEIDLQNAVSENNIQADIDQMESRIQSYRAELGICKTDIQHCDQQMTLWQEKKKSIFRRQSQIEKRMDAAKISKRAFEDSVESI